jgi:hypothetical protein
MDADEYLVKRLENQITWYDGKSTSAKRRFHALRALEIIAATLIPAFAGLAKSQIAYALPAVSISGVIVAICTGLTSLFQYQEHWIKYRTTAESLKKEKYLFLTKVQPRR